MKLTQLQKDLIFGSLLGDGNLQSFSQGRTWRYRALQKDKDYLFHKYEILNPLCKMRPIEETIEDKRTGNTSTRSYFNTLVSAKLRVFANMFYTYDSKQKKWIKDVPLKNLLLHWLTPRALAYFYMDDGSLKWPGHSNAMRISTENFSQEGVKRIRNSLKELYDIDTGVTKKKLKDDKIGLIITIPEKSSNSFRELIQPYLVDCMKYKVLDGQL